MKKLLIILVMLLWTNIVFADELFGIKLGDNIKNYKKWYHVEERKILCQKDIAENHLKILAQ